MNKWKYATLSESEKMNRISKGDNDLYESEKENANSYKNLLSRDGIDTSAVDRYISKLESASGNAVKADSSLSSKKENDNAAPKYMQGKKNEEMLAVLNALKDIYASYVSGRENLLLQKKQAKDNVLEQLHAMGYSVDGQRGKKELYEVSEYYENLLEKHDKRYIPDIKNALKLLGIDKSTRDIRFSE